MKRARLPSRSGSGRPRSGLLAAAFLLGAIAIGPAWALAADDGGASPDGSPPAPTELAPGVANAPGPASAPGLASAPAPIPVPRIPEATEALQKTLRRLADGSAPVPAVVAIEAELPGLRSEVEGARLRTSALLRRSPSLDRLRDLEVEWTARVGSIASRRQKLAERAARLEADFARLASLRQQWSETLDRARAVEAPRNVLSAVEANLAAIASVTASVRDRRAGLLSDLAALSEVEVSATETRQQLVAERARLRARLLEPDQGPIGQSLDAAASLSLEALAREKRAEWRELLDFVREHGADFVPIFVGFLVVAWLAIAVRDRLRRSAGADQLEGSAGVFERPLSTAVVTTSLIGATAFPFAPGLARDLIGTLLVVPILRLLWPSVPVRARPVLGTLAAFYLVDRLRDVLITTPGLERLIFLASTLAAAIVLVVYLRPSRLAQLPSDASLPSGAGAGLRLALIAFLAASGANAMGYVALARVLGDGTLGAIYLAVLAYALFRITATLVALAFQTGPLLAIGAVSRHRAQLAGWATRGLAVVAGLGWALASLDAFAIQDVVLDAANAVVATPLELGTLSISLGSVIAFPLTLLAAWLLSAAIRALLEEDVYPRVTLQRGVGNAVSTALHYALLLGGFLLALGAAGIDLSKFTVLAGAFGVGIGFGLQTVVNNFVSGLILLFERPIQAGDTIELGSLLGQVRKIGIRASTIQTFQGAEVIVPNGNLLSDQLINWTLSNETCRIEIPFGVAYGNDPERVIGVVLEVLREEPRALAEPPPNVLFRGFGDSSLNFEARLWIAEYGTFPRVKSDVSTKIFHALAKAGIEIPFPQRDLHVRSVSPEAARQLGGRGDET